MSRSNEGAKKRGGGGGSGGGQARAFDPKQYMEFAPPGTTTEQILEISKKHNDKDKLKEAISMLWDGTLCVCLCGWVRRSRQAMGWNGMGSFD